MAQTIYVGMSGGVDSSVTAALLKQAGYNVVGVYMKNWTKSLAGFACPWRQDLTDAQSVAARLDIPLKIFDFQKQYKQKVVDYMIKEYKAGNTPNPDIMCNQEIKFKLFLETALEAEADLIATGHYARIVPNGSRKPKIGSQLYVAQDKNKDQSYFLYRVTKTALAKTLMPLGKLTKAEVRELAKSFNLPTADKPDSQGICFVGKISIKDFLSQYIKTEPGPIKTLDGTTIGEHDGAVFYTIGQRHGLKVGGGLPYYVVGKDMKTNTVFVTKDLADQGLHRDRFLIGSPHWTNEEPQPGTTYQIRTRYRGRLVNGTLAPIRDPFLQNAKSFSGKTKSQDFTPHFAKNGSHDQKWQVKLSEPERAITPGQSAVVYDGELVIGGGIIILL